MTGLDHETRLAHRRRNRVQSALLIGGLALLVAVPALLMWGVSGLVLAAAFITAVVLFAPRLSPETTMRMYRAREVRGADGGLVELVQVLAARAELGRPPRVFIVPSDTINAFATGTRETSAIALTTGLLSRLSPRELVGVVAHEISHIRNNDLWVMGLADVMSRFTLAMSYSAMVLAGLNLLAIMSGAQASVPWLAVLFLYAAPTLSSLLQLGLSRAREYDADLEGALLTGDPQGLASALIKIERITGSFWEDLAFPVPGRRIPQPSLLRTHPTVEDRVARLEELARGPARAAMAALHLPGMNVLPPSRIGPPRYRFPGVWY